MSLSPLSPVTEGLFFWGSDFVELLQGSLYFIGDDFLILFKIQDWWLIMMIANRRLVEEIEKAVARVIMMMRHGVKLFGG